jgi:hypothetical protein
MIQSNIAQLLCIEQKHAERYIHKESRYTMLHPVFDRFTTVTIASGDKLYNQFAFYLFGIKLFWMDLTTWDADCKPDGGVAACWFPGGRHATSRELERVVVILRRKPQKTDVEVRALERLEALMFQSQTGLETSSCASADVANLPTPAQ